MFEEAAKNRRELQEATILETGKQLAQLEQEVEEFRSDFKLCAPVTNGQPSQQPTASNITMVPVVPGDIIHSNDVNREEMAIGLTQNPEWQSLGLSSGTGALAVKLLLTQLQTKALSVALPPQAPAVDVQTANMEADAAAKRKLEEADDEWADESVCPDQKDLEEVQQAETGDKPPTRLRVKRSTKRSQSSKGGGKGQ